MRYFDTEEEGLCHCSYRDKYVYRIYTSVTKQPNFVLIIASFLLKQCLIFSVAIHVENKVFAVTSRSLKLVSLRASCKLLETIKQITRVVPCKVWLYTKYVCRSILAYLVKDDNTITWYIHGVLTYSYKVLLRLEQRPLSGLHLKISRF